MVTSCINQHTQNGNKAEIYISSSCLQKNNKNRTYNENKKSEFRKMVAKTYENLQNS